MKKKNKIIISFVKIRSKLATFANLKPCSQPMQQMSCSSSSGGSIGGGGGGSSSGGGISYEYLIQQPTQSLPVNSQNLLINPIQQMQQIDCNTDLNNNNNKSSTGWIMPTACNNSAANSTFQHQHNKYCYQMSNANVSVVTNSSVNSSQRNSSSVTNSTQPIMNSQGYAAEFGFYDKILRKSPSNSFTYGR